MTNRTDTHRRGFTLLEILITLGLMGIVMMLAYSQLFKTTERVGRELDLTEVREIARMAVEMIANDIANVGLGVDEVNKQPKVLGADAFQMVFCADLDADKRPDDPTKTGALCLVDLYPTTNDLNPTIRDGTRLYLIKELIPDHFNFLDVSLWRNWGACDPADPVGAEVVRYSFDYVGQVEQIRQRQLSYDNLDDAIYNTAWGSLPVTEVRERPTNNPFDFYLIREVWGTRKNSLGTLENYYSGPVVVARNIRGFIADGNYGYPNGDLVKPLFSYWGHFVNDITVPDDPTDPNWPGEDLDLWADVRPPANGDGILTNWELNNLYTNLFSVSYATEDADGNGVLDPGEDRNGNGLLDKGIGDVLQKMDVQVTVETGDAFPQYPNGPRSSQTAQYLYHDVVSNRSIAPRGLSRALPYNAIPPEPPTAPPPPPTNPPTDTPVVTSTPTLTPTETPSPTPPFTPTPTPTPTAYPVMIPTAVAEVVVGAFFAEANSDRVRVWALTDVAIPPDFEQGDRLEPPLTILSEATTPLINGQVVDIRTFKVFQGAGFYNDIVVLTDGTQYPTEPNLYIFRNKNDDNPFEIGLQYEFSAAIRADEGLPPMAGVAAIEPAFVRVLNVNSDSDLYNKQEIAVFFNLTLTNGEHSVYVLIYRNTSNDPKEFIFDPAGYPQYNLELPDPCRVIGVEVGNLDHRPLYNPNPDDYVMIVEPDYSTQPTIYLVTRSETGTGMQVRNTVDLIGRRQPTKLAIGEFFSFNNQPPGLYPDFAFAVAPNFVFLYQNNYDRPNHPPPNDDPTLNRFLTPGKTVAQLRGADIYSPYNIDDLLITCIKSPTTSQTTTLLYRTEIDSQMRLVDEMTIGTQPKFSCLGSISSPDGMIDIIIVDTVATPAFEGRHVGYIGLQRELPGLPYGRMSFETDRWQRTLPGPQEIRAMEFTQHAGGQEPPDARARAASSKHQSSYLDRIKDRREQGMRYENLELNEIQNWTKLP